MMSVDHPDYVAEPVANGTPSTASRIKSAPPENAFPTPPKRDTNRASDAIHDGRLSPAPSRLFGIGKASPAPKEHKSVEALKSNLTRGISSGRSSANELDKSYQKSNVSKKSSQFFDQAFAVREPYHSAKERVTRDSMVVVDLQVNTCLDTQQGFYNDFLMCLSETYSKPPNNIVIVANTDVHIMIGGSTEPGYLVTITGLPGEIAPTRNLRATVIVQQFLADSLKIPESRGVVMFNAVKEDQIATNKMTIQDEIEKLESEEKRGLSLRSRQSNRTKRGSTMPSMSESNGETDQSRSQTPILRPSNIVDDDEDEFDKDLLKEKPLRPLSSAGKRMMAKKSIMSFWKKS